MTLIKSVLLALLAANAVFFAVAGTASKAVDAAAWLVLLILFEAEASRSGHLTSPRCRSALRAARLIAGAGVIAAMVGYVFEENGLDAVNSVLWIAVVVLLEIEVREPALVARARFALSAITAALYGSLGVLVIAWAVRGQWVDAYDALLWLIAFATIEMDVLGKEAPATPSG